MIEIRTDYDKRDALQERLHREYGKYIFLQDVDSMCDSVAGLKIFMETNGSDSVGLADFKNDAEEIYLWKLKPMINLANLAKIPAYVSVIYREPYVFYYIIPLNDYAKSIMGDRRAMSEATYIKFLYALRSSNPPEELLKDKSHLIPNEFKQPNIKG